MQLKMLSLMQVLISRKFYRFLHEQIKPLLNGKCLLFVTSSDVFYITNRYNSAAKIAACRKQYFDTLNMKRRIFIKTKLIYSKHVSFKINEIKDEFYSYEFILKLPQKYSFEIQSILDLTFDMFIYNKPWEYPLGTYAPKEFFKNNQIQPWYKVGKKI